MLCFSWGHELPTMQSSLGLSSQFGFLIKLHFSPCPCVHAADKTESYQWCVPSLRHQGRDESFQHVNYQLCINKTGAGYENSVMSVLLSFLTGQLHISCSTISRLVLKFTNIHKTSLVVTNGSSRWHLTKNKAFIALYTKLLFVLWRCFRWY